MPRAPTHGYAAEGDLPDGRIGAIALLTYGRARIVVFREGDVGPEDGW
jgi:hypothetical protein